MKVPTLYSSDISHIFLIDNNTDNGEITCISQDETCVCIGTQSGQIIVRRLDKNVINNKTKFCAR